ncbi:MAG: hypothetical protein R3Y43_01575 [Alphaproteobacteria bacterium]
MNKEVLALIGVDLDYYVKIEALIVKFKQESNDFIASEKNIDRIYFIFLDQYLLSGFQTWVGEYGEDFIIQFAKNNGCSTVNEFSFIYRWHNNIRNFYERSKWIIQRQYDV